VARRIADALRAGGVDVWFDQSELRGGETWDHRIRRQIKECGLFIPVISEQTQARREGYFRLEWKLAEERTHLMAKGTAFLVPVCIDTTHERTALVPDSFLMVQWTRLPGGETPSAFCGQVKRLLAGGAEATATSQAVGVPPRIPDYELLRMIGQGSYGDVWLARGVTGIHRAIKVVWRERFADAGPFKREFHGLEEFAAISLGESIQLALLHIGRNDEAGFFYYVMELADDAERGHEIDPARYVPLTLAEMRTRRGRIPAAECVTLAVELARVLAGLHARGLVHRDIKPSNVILVGGVPKLADIGLVTPASSARTFIGTEGFVPPEGPGSPRADVFALGKLIYELSTGLDRQQFPQLPPELNRLPDHRALLKLNEVILRACDPLPERRYADGRALLAALLTLQAGGPVRRHKPGRRLVLLAAAAVVALGLGWFGLRPPAAKPAPPTQEKVAPTAKAATPVAPVADKSLLVLPLENLSSDPDKAYLADGIHRELVFTLSRIPDLTVTSRESAMLLKGLPLSLAEKARRVGAANVLTGSVQCEGDRVRVWLELRRAADEALLLPLPKQDRALTDRLVMQDEIASEVARTLQAREAKGRRASAQFYTSNPQAYELYNKAVAKGDPTGSNHDEPIRLLEEALKLDPKFMTAANVLSTYHVFACQTSLVDEERKHHAAEAKRWAEEASRLASGGAGDSALAVYYFTLGQDNIRALNLIEGALRALPNDSLNHNRRGVALAYLGRLPEAIDSWRRSIELDPLNDTPWRSLVSAIAHLRRPDEYRIAVADWSERLGVAPDSLARPRWVLFGEVPDKPPGSAISQTYWLLTAGRPGKALELSDANPATDKMSVRQRFDYAQARATVLLRLGRTAESQEIGKTLIELAKEMEALFELDESVREGRMARALALAGRQDEAIAMMTRFVVACSPTTRTTDRWAREIEEARLYAQFDRRREALVIIKRLLRVPSGLTVPMLRKDPAWDNLRNDPEFESLLADPKNDAPL
jgi:TolB-like protein